LKAGIARCFGSGRRSQTRPARAITLTAIGTLRTDTEGFQQPLKLDMSLRAALFTYTESHPGGGLTMEIVRKWNPEIRDSIVESLRVISSSCRFTDKLEAVDH